MVLQVTLVSELMATDRTAKFLLPVVPVGQMTTKVALLSETFVANRAVELEEAAMDGGLMKAQIVLRAQHLPADVARKLPTLGHQRCCRLTLHGRCRWETSK